MVIPLVLAAVCLAAGLVAALAKKHARHLLAPALVPLALVPAVLASALAATYLRMAFSESAAAGIGADRTMGELLVDVARTVFVSRLCSLALLALAGLLVLRGLGGPLEAVDPRVRGVILTAGALVAVGMTLLVGSAEGRMSRTVQLSLMPADMATPAAEQELKELVTGSRSSARLGVAQVSGFLGRQILVLTFAAPALALAFVLITAILAAVGWRPPQAGSPHGPAITLVVALAVMGAWTSSAYRRVGEVRRFATAFAESERRRARQPVPSPVVERERDAPADSLLSRCEAGDAKDCALVGRGLDDAERVTFYERVCAKAGGEVCADLASLHLNGIGTAADPARAKKLYERACRTGDHSACGLFEQLSKTAR